MKIEKVLKLDNEVYHNSEQYKEFWSSSNLKKYTESSKEAFWQKSQPSKQTPAMRLGTLIHDMLESKHVNGSDWNYNIFSPPVNDKTGKPYGATSQKFLDALSIVENPISEDELQTVNDIWEMIMKSPYNFIFQEIMQKGEPEASFFVTDEKTGLKYKYRPDLLQKNSIIDWKTITKQKWSANGIKRTIQDLHYDVSAAMYQFFEYHRTGVWKPFIIYWIMKEPPYDILRTDISGYCYELINDFLVKNAGAILFESLKLEHETCMQKSYHPGIASRFMPDNSGTNTAILTPDNWYTNQFSLNF